MIRHDADQWQKLKALALDSVASPHSKRAYETALDNFLAWYNAASRPCLSKAAMHAYKAQLVEAGLSTINVRLSALRKLVSEAADNGLIPPDLACIIAKVRGVSRHGVRMGNWLELREAERLINAPDTGTLVGKRDRALLAVLIGCGLRRSEAAALTFRHMQQRENRWVIVDLVGKHGRIRSVPMPAWAKLAVDEWSAASGIHTGRVFRPVNRGGRLAHEFLSSKCIWFVCGSMRLASNCPILAPHDLRRTYARLAHQGGAKLEQIQLRAAIFRETNDNVALLARETSIAISGSSSVRFAGDTFSHCCAQHLLPLQLRYFLRFSRALPFCTL